VVSLKLDPHSKHPTQAAAVIGAFTQHLFHICSQQHRYHGMAWQMKASYIIKLPSSEKGQNRDTVHSLCQPCQIFILKCWENSYSKMGARIW